MTLKCGINQEGNVDCIVLFANKSGYQWSTMIQGDEQQDGHLGKLLSP